MCVSWLHVCRQGTTQRSSSVLDAHHERTVKCLIESVSFGFDVLFVTLGVRMYSITDRQNGGDGERGKPDSRFRAVITTVQRHWVRCKFRVHCSRVALEDFP